MHRKRVSVVNWFSIVVLCLSILAPLAAPPVVAAQTAAPEETGQAEPENKAQGFIPYLKKSPESLHRVFDDFVSPAFVSEGWGYHEHSTHYNGSTKLRLVRLDFANDLNVSIQLSVTLDFDDGESIFYTADIPAKSAEHRTRRDPEEMHVPGEKVKITVCNGTDCKSSQQEIVYSPKGWGNLWTQDFIEPCKGKTKVKIDPLTKVDLLLEGQEYNLFDGLIAANGKTEYDWTQYGRHAGEGVPFQIRYRATNDPFLPLNKTIDLGPEYLECIPTKSSLEVIDEGGMCVTDQIREAWVEIKNGGKPGEGDMFGPVLWELYHSDTGNPKQGAVVDSGEFDPIGGGETGFITRTVAATGKYMFKIEQEQGHPGTGEIWSDEIVIDLSKCKPEPPTKCISANISPTKIFVGERTTIHEVVAENAESLHVQWIQDGDILDLPPLPTDTPFVYFGEGEYVVTVFAKDKDGKLHTSDACQQTISVTEPLKGQLIETVFCTGIVVNGTISHPPAQVNYSTYQGISGTVDVLQPSFSLFIPFSPPVADVEIVTATVQLIKDGNVIETLNIHQEIDCREPEPEPTDAECVEAVFTPTQGVEPLLVTLTKVTSLRAIKHEVSWDGGQSYQEFSLDNLPSHTYNAGPHKAIVRVWGDDDQAYTSDACRSEIVVEAKEPEPTGELLESSISCKVFGFSGTVSKDAVLQFTTSEGDSGIVDIPQGNFNKTFKWAQSITDERTVTVSGTLKVGDLVLDTVTYSETVDCREQEPEPIDLSLSASLSCSMVSLNGSITPKDVPGNLDYTLSNGQSGSFEVIGSFNEQVAWQPPLIDFLTVSAKVTLTVESQVLTKQFERMLNCKKPIPQPEDPKPTVEKLSDTEKVDKGAKFTETVKVSNEFPTTLILTSISLTVDSGIEVLSFTFQGILGDPPVIPALVPAAVFSTTTVIPIDPPITLEPGMVAEWLLTGRMLVEGAQWNTVCVVSETENGIPLEPQCASAVINAEPTALNPGEQPLQQSQIYLPVLGK